jgi:hypothetical protein
LFQAKKNAAALAPCDGITNQTEMTFCIRAGKHVDPLIELAELWLSLSAGTHPRAESCARCSRILLIAIYLRPPSPKSSNFCPSTTAKLIRN